jgi:hypothetical protein
MGAGAGSWRVQRGWIGSRRASGATASPPCSAGRKTWRGANAFCARISTTAGRRSQPPPGRWYSTDAACTGPVQRAARCASRGMVRCGGVRPCQGCARIARRGPAARAGPVSGCSGAIPADGPGIITRRGPLGRNSTRHGSSRAPNGMRHSAISRQRPAGAARSVSRVVPYSAATSPAPIGRHPAPGQCRSGRSSFAARRPDRDEGGRCTFPCGARRRGAVEVPAAAGERPGRAHPVLAAADTGLTCARSGERTHTEVRPSRSSGHGCTPTWQECPKRLHSRRCPRHGPGPAQGRALKVASGGLDDPPEAPSPKRGTTSA